MKSKRIGKGTLDVEVTHISMGGVWVLINDKEYFLPFKKFPVFRDATVGAIHNVQFVNDDHISWPDLDVELSLDSMGTPETIPVYSK